MKKSATSTPSTRRSATSKRPVVAVGFEDAAGEFENWAVAKTPLEKDQAGRRCRWPMAELAELLSASIT